MARIILLHVRGRGARKGPAFFAVFCLLMATSVTDAQVRLDVERDRVAVDVHNVSIRQVLEALANEGLLDVDASVDLDAPVTLQTSAEPLERLLRRLLRQYSYTLIVHDASSARAPRLRVFSDANPGAPITWQSRLSSATGTIDRAVADLADPDDEVREEALLTLSDSGDRDIVAHFIGSLQDPSPSVREAARAAIEDMETTDFGDEFRLTKQGNDE